MSSFRNILQRCARKASRNSILASTPLQIQCTFNPVYSAYPTSISRQAYSSDGNEAPKNDPVRKYILEMMNAGKSRPNNAEDREAPTTSKAAKAPTFNRTDSMNSRPNIISPPSVTEDQRSAKTPTFHKNLNLRKYYINIYGLSKETTPESLRKFYSHFGEIALCRIVFYGEPKQFGNVAFTSRIAMNRALNSLPHCIDGKEIKNVGPSTLGKKQLTLQVLDLSPKTTTKSLKEFYSKFGRLDDCCMKQGANAKVAEVTFVNQNDLHNALDAQPHVIDGSEVFLKYVTFDLDLRIPNIPEGITEEALREFYSKYGQLRVCQLFKGKAGPPHAYVSYSAIDEVNRAMDDRPHLIGGKPLQVGFLGKHHGSAPVSLFVGSLPENVTEETLRKEFFKYGKLVYWKLENDGQFNQSGPYGLVTYGSEEEALKVLKSGPHTIKGAVVDVRMANEAKKSWPGKEKSIDTDENAVTLELRDVPESVTVEELIDFYSKYGRVRQCRLRNGKTGIPYALVSFSTIDELNRAMNDRPHIIGGKPLKATNISADQKASKSKIVEDEKAGKVPIFEASKAPTFNKTDSLNSRPNIKSWPSVTKVQNAPKAPSFNKTDSMNSRPNIKSWPSVTKDQNAPKAPIFNKNLNLQRSRSNIVPEDKKSTKSFTADSAQQTPFGHIDLMKSPPNIDKDEKVTKTPTFNKNLNLRKYYINIRGLSINTTPESLRKFYSQFGEIAVCRIVTLEKLNRFGSVAFLEKKAMDRALNSLPHCIDGKKTDNVWPSTLGRKELTLQVLDLSPKTTTESLRKFYSKFGRLDDCWIKQRANAKVAEVTFVNQNDVSHISSLHPITLSRHGLSLHHSVASNAPCFGRSALIDGSEVLLLYATFDLDLRIPSIPEGITEEELIAFYSKYGQLRRCHILKGKDGPYAYVSFSEIAEVNRAMEDRPHIIHGKPLPLSFIGRGHGSSPVSLFVASLPENVTEETLRDEFSKYGNPICWKLQNDGQFNQSGPYGIVIYGSEEEALKALKSGPHTIKGAVVDVRMANEAKKSFPGKEKCIDTDENAVTLEIRDVPESVTVEELIDFYSKYGRVRECRLRNGKTGIPYALVSFSTIDEALNALNSGPHTIKGAVVDVRMANEAKKSLPGNEKSIGTDENAVTENTSRKIIEIRDVPEGVTKEELIGFYSKYGRVEECRLVGLVTYGSPEEALKALKNGPHTTKGSVIDVRMANGANKSLPGKEKSIGTDKNILTFEIRDVPEGVTKEDLIAFYSKYGRVEECRLRNGKTGIPHAFVSYSAVDEVK